MILVRNNDRNLRFPDNFITDFKNRLKRASARNCKVFEAVSAQMIRNRASRRFDHVRLCLDIARNTTYAIKATIKNIGTDDPTGEINPTSLELTVSVANWALDITQDVTFE